MHVHAENPIWYQRVNRCNQNIVMRLSIWDVKLSQRKGEMKFSLYVREDKPLVEGVTQFQYLGRTLKHMQNDWS